MKCLRGMRLEAAGPRDCWFSNRVTYRESVPGSANVEPEIVDSHGEAAFVNDLKREAWLVVRMGSDRICNLWNDTEPHSIISVCSPLAPEAENKTAKRDYQRRGFTERH